MPIQGMPSLGSGATSELPAAPRSHRATGPRPREASQPPGERVSGPRDADVKGKLGSVELPVNERPRRDASAVQWPHYAAKETSGGFRVEAVRIPMWARSLVITTDYSMKALS